MSAQVFDLTPPLGSDVAPAEFTDAMENEYTYRASLLQEGGLTAATFVEFAGRFALLCDQTYQGSTVELLLDRAHPNITIECDELHEMLAEQPGDVIPTPANVDVFCQAFATARTADLIIKPSTELAGMPSTFAMVSWERSAAALMNFYAQGGSSPAGKDFEQGLYARMFNVAESAPRKGIDVALGICAVEELRRYGIGSRQYFDEKLENFDNISTVMGLPGSAHYLDKQGVGRHFLKYTPESLRRMILLRLRRIF